MRTKTQQELIDIIRFEICGTPLPEGFSVSDEDALIRMAKKHDLTHMVYDALTRNGLPCSSSFAMQQYYASIWRAEQMTHELSSMTDVFQAEGIDIMPLKGAVMRPMYPESWMRTSADIDVLFRKDDFDRACAILKDKLGYTEDQEERSSHHISFRTPANDIHVEAHHELFSDIHLGQAVLDIMPEIWFQARPEDGQQHLMRMSDACFYFYHIAHMTKHLVKGGGCSIRGLIDLWLLDRLPQKDETGRRELLERSGLDTFARTMSAMSEAWFADGMVPSEELEQFILTGYMYGNMQNQVALGVDSYGAGKYALKRIFLPYDLLKQFYPVIQKHKILTPVFEVVRWTRIFRKDYRKRLRNQTETLLHTGRGEVEQIGRIKQVLGIDHIKETSNV